MSGTPVVCAKCKVQVVVTPDPKPDDRVTCPTCGDSETFQDFERSLGEQVKEHAQAKLEASFKGLKGWSYTKGSRSQGVHRFIVKLD